MHDMTIAFLGIEAETAENGKPGFPPAVGLAVSACESGWWQHVTGAYIFFGSRDRLPSRMIRRAPWCPTTEVITPTQLASFCADERTTAVFLANNTYSMHRWFAVPRRRRPRVRVHLLIDSTRYDPAWQAFHNGSHLSMIQTNSCARPVQRVTLRDQLSKSRLAIEAPGQCRRRCNGGGQTRGWSGAMKAAFLTLLGVTLIDVSAQALAVSQIYYKLPGIIDAPL